LRAKMPCLLRGFLSNSLLKWNREFLSVTGNRNSLLRFRSGNCVAMQSGLSFLDALQNDSNSAPGCKSAAESRHHCHHLLPPPYESVRRCRVALRIASLVRGRRSRRVADQRIEWPVRHAGDTMAGHSKTPGFSPRLEFLVATRLDLLHLEV